MSYSFRTTTKINADTYIEDRGYPHQVVRGSNDFAIVDAEMHFLRIGQTAVKTQDGDGWDVVDGFPLLEALKAEKLRDINARCDAALRGLTAEYPDTERLTFDQQKSEALALESDANAEAPMLRALAQHRGIALDDLTHRVLAKANAFSLATGILMGQRQHMEDLLDACKTPADVTAIKVSYSLA